MEEEIDKVKKTEVKKFWLEESEWELRGFLITRTYKKMALWSELKDGRKILMIETNKMI